MRRTCLYFVLGLIALCTAIVISSAQDDKPKGANYAFLVACSEYREGQFKKLPYAYKETEDFRQALLATGFDDQHIVFLHDKRTEDGGRFLPFKDHILDELDVLAARLTKDDTLVVLFDGHGLHFKGDKGSYFCPTNVKLDRKDTMVPLDSDKGVYALLQNCKAGRKLLLVNACRNDPDPLNQAATKDSFDNEAKELLPEGVAALFSCSPGQKCYYYPPSAKIERSLFMNHLIEAWQGTYAKGEQLTLEDVFKEVRSKAAEDAAKLFGEKQIAVIDRKYSGNWVVNSGAAKDGKEIASKTLPSLKLVRIAAKGKAFTMGSPKNEKDRSDDETQHEVKFSADYYMGVTTVTRGQFAAFVKDDDYKTEAEKGDGGGGWDDDKKEWKNDKKYNWRNPGFAQTDAHPVVNVSWNDAVAFCKWLSRKDGREYRLPTEAQWEYACRAGSRTRFNYGDDEEELWKHGNVADAKFREATKNTYGIKNSDGYAFTAPVGQYQKNAYGLQDMHGNVYQLCSDVYGEYPTEAVTDPQGPAVKEGSVRVIRGGSWNGYPLVCRSAHRIRHGPSYRFVNLGFRLAVPVR